MATITNNSYKARFCNQYFSDLCSFVKKFDISLKTNERNNISNLKYYNNDLGMNFLLASYDKHDYKNLVGEELKNAERTIRARKTNTYWELKEVTNADLMQAVDEYFEITSTGKKLKEQQDVLMQNLLDPLKERFTYISPEDITLRAILLTVGVLPKEKKTEIGSQIEELKKFISCAKGDEFAYKDEGRFVNALNLYKELRNLQAHELVKYDGLRKMIFHKFIAFTYIGTIYLCRRLWRDYESSLCESSYTKPQKFKSRETIDVIIETKGNQKITSCLYNYGDDIISPHIELPNKNVSFPMEVRRYEEVQIKVVCDGTKEDVIKRTFKYDYWNSAIFILIPDANTDYHVVDVAGEGHEDIDSCMSRIVNQLSSQVAEEVRDIVLETLGNFTPKFEEIKATGNQELSQEVKEDLEFLSLQLDGLTNEQQNGFNTINKKIEELNNSLKDSYNKQLLESIGKTVKEIKDDTTYIRRIIESVVSFFKKPIAILPYIPLLYAVFAFVSFAFFDYSLWLWPLSCFQNIVWSVIILVGLPLFILCVFLWSKGGPSIKNIKLLKSKDWGIIAATFFFLLTVIPLVPNRIEKYDWGSSTHNSKAAEFIENSINDLPISDEPARIQLITYYLQHNEQPQKALDIAAPMITDKTGKYIKGLVACAEAYYRSAKYETVDTIKREKYVKAQQFINDYYKLSNDSLPALFRLEGILSIFGNKENRNVKIGLPKIERAAKEGDPEAQYYYGYILSHNTVDFDNIIQIENGKEYTWGGRLNLFDAIQSLWKASKSLPKADIELGNIYADLNMNDSASYYYNRAIERTKPLKKSDKIGDLHKEALYRMALLCETMDNDTINKYLIDAADAYNYGPAKFHKAMRTKAYDEAIVYYKDYNGYQYIPPVAFIYIKLRNFEKALEVMQKHRPNGQFNIEFVYAINAWLSKDKEEHEKRWDWLRKSAAKGCLFAEMVCTIWDMEGDFNNIYEKNKQNVIADVSKDIIPLIPIIDNNLDKLFTIAQEIPFAYSLLASEYLHLGDVIMTDRCALKAISKKHPSGAYILGDMKSNYFNTSKCLYAPTEMLDSIGKQIVEVAGDSIPDIGTKISLLETSLRIVKYSPMKEMCMLLASELNLYRSIMAADEISIDYLEFWSNVAIANHSFYNELWQLSAIANKSSRNIYDPKLQRRLVEAALEDIPRTEKGEIDHVNFITLNVLAEQIMKLGLKDDLNIKYEKDPIIKNIINMQIFPIIGDVHLDYSGMRTYSYNMFSIRSLLYEFSDVMGNNVFDEPL